MGDENKKTSYNYRILAAVDSSIAAGRDFVVGRGWTPLVNVGLFRIITRLIAARTSIVALMSRITVGRLRVLAPEQIYEFGSGGELSAELKVVSDAVWVRLLLLGDLVRRVIRFLISGICRSIYAR
jgi:cyclopropane-fatty-acyl-phospholipid synthase